MIELMIVCVVSLIIFKVVLFTIYCKEEKENERFNDIQ